ncbi:MAG: GTPase HflX [Candidatus Thorarchaeota archaeon]
MSELKTLLVQRRLPSEPNLMDEFKALVDTAGYEVLGVFDIVSRPSSRYGIRTGKVEEIKTWIEVNEPDIVFFSPALRSSQIYRLMEEWGVEVRDRTQLILEIFDRHARTQQAKLQIEQARLKYELPFERHQIRMRLQKEHTGDRPTTDQVGIGEDLVNLQVQHLRRRISKIGEKLKKITAQQKLKKKQRQQKGFTEIALAGYTNAGKSTLHDALTGSAVRTADELFTTLSTKTTSLGMKGRRVVLSDSVGFISDLPQSLLKAFNTTLMAIGESDVIVLVVDGSDSIDEMERKVTTCLDTFERIDANGVPMIYALNKIDLLSEKETLERVELLSEHGHRVVPISAMNRTGMDDLILAIDNLLPDLRDYSLKLSSGDAGMSILSWLHDNAIITDEQYDGDSITVRLRMSPDTVAKLETMHPEAQLSVDLE